jgi:N-acyl-L-homoserine lactone synthetase
MFYRNITRSLSLVEIIKDKTDTRCLEVYKLRYDVVVNQHKMKINPAHIYNGSMICDEHDLSDATTHYALRNSHTGKLVSAIRTVDANKTKIDMEKYNWFKLDESIKKDGVVEWSRLVSDASVRKTNAALLLYIKSVFHSQESGINNITFMVDSRATQLMKYYKLWSPCNELSNGPVNCDEYEPGRKSHVMLISMGKPNTFERFKFETCVCYPGMAGVSFMKDYNLKK